MQVGKISLYAASSAIKEVQKLVLDPKYVNFTLVLIFALVLSPPPLSCHLSVLSILLSTLEVLCLFLCCLILCEM